MGTTIAALEEMGIVERQAHPTDGRHMNLELTAKGAAVRKSTGDAKRTWLVEAIAQLDKQEQATGVPVELLSRICWPTASVPGQ